MLTVLLALLPFVSQDSLSRKDIESAVDRSVSWLRAQQDLTTGAYGTAHESAHVLAVLKRCHRGYVASDGPFIARLVDFLEGQELDGDARACADYALTGAGERVLEDPCGLYASADYLADRSEDVEAELAAAAASVAARGADGAWNGDLVETLGRLERLIRAAKLAKSVEAKSNPKEAKPLPALSPADRAEATKALLRGAGFLSSEMVEPGKWGFQGQADPGITAMVLGALLSAPAGEGRETIDAGLDWLVSLQREDGSIHAGQLANYVTSAAVMALARAGREQDAPVIARAKNYLVLLQSDEGEGYTSSDRFYGGVGYGGDQRPDLSNLQMALEALHEAGVPSGDETFQKALTFLQRCQNRSESNDFVLETETGVIASGNDGGAAYAPGDSKAGYVELADGRKIPRSYGSMTYALLKGYLFAGLSKDDPRVEAAWGWLTRNYTLDVNPGFEGSSDPTAAYQGLFYYFTTMAKALDLYGEETIVDAAGQEHAWRGELAGRLVAMQRQDGSWVNANAPRWYEGNPVLATSYAMLALGTALP